MLGNRGLNFVVNLLFRIGFTDLCYGYNAFWRDCLDFFDVDCEGFEVETLMTLRARKANLKIVEVPSVERSRLHGSSNLRTFRDGWRVLRTIAKEWMLGYSTIKTPGIRHLIHRNYDVIAQMTATSPRLVVPQLYPVQPVETTIGA